MGFTINHHLLRCLIVKVTNSPELELEHLDYYYDKYKTGVYQAQNANKDADPSFH